MVDALASGASGGNPVEVQVLSWAPSVIRTLAMPTRANTPSVEIKLPRPSWFGRSKPLNLLKGAIECIGELQGVVFVEDQRRADFQHVGVGAVNSHKYP